MPGLMHVNLGGYHVRDIEFSAAFDVDAQQSRPGPVRGHLRRAQQHRSSSPTCRTWASTVNRGMTHDGLGKYLSEVISKAAGPTVDIAEILRDTGTDVVVSYLPVGSRDGDQVVRRADPGGRLRVRQLHPGVHRPRGLLAASASRERGLPIIGDDIKSQVGATITHRDAGPPVPRARRASSTAPTSSTSAATPISNMLERERLESKKISKTSAVTSQLDYELPAEDVHVGPSDYVPWLTDRKWAHIRLEGTHLRRRAAQHRAEARGLGLARTAPAWSSTRSAAPSWRSTAASAARSRARRPTS